jgi:hypothetical protein
MCSETKAMGERRMALPSFAAFSMQASVGGPIHFSGPTRD